MLELRPKPSAGLSPHVLAGLLEKYAGLTDFRIGARLKEFTEDASHPYAVRDNVRYLNEIGDFSSHTQKDDQAKLIDVEPDEAKWTLDLIERLFDYFIVTPAKDAEMRAAMDQKI